MILYPRQWRCWQVVLGGSIVFNGGLWLLVLLTFPRQAPVSVLHYSVGVGIDIIGQGREILTLPLIGTMTLAGNVLLAWWLRRANQRAAWIFLSINPIIQAILLAAYILLWRLNV
jgi:hypothetical protein